jgi:hypothetical protein
VRVTPAARKDVIAEVKPGVFEVSVREPAKDNRANERVCKVLAAHFSVPFKNVRIMSGHTKSAKMVAIHAHKN